MYLLDVCMCVWESVEHVIVLIRTEVQGREQSSAQFRVSRANKVHLN